MKRLLAGGLALALSWQSQLHAQSGVTLGRPQVLPAVAAPSAIRQTGFAVGAPVPAPEPDLSYFASGGANWPLPPTQAPAPKPLPSAPVAQPQPGTVIATNKPVPTTTLPMPSPVPAAPTMVTSAGPEGFGGDCCGGDCCCDPCCDDGPGHWLHPRNWCCADHCYASAEYLLWWTKGAGTPALVTTGPAAGAGILGAPGTTVLFGGTGALDHDAFSGGRFTIGCWADPEETRACELTFFFLGSKAVNFEASSPGSPLLARPFFSANTNTEFSKILATPGVQEGAIRITAPTNFWGIEANWRKNLCQDGGRRWDLLLGSRFLELREGLHISDYTRALGTTDYAITQDNFDTLNQFFGGQVGLQWQCKAGAWSIEARAKVALGLGYRSSTINGNTLNQTAAAGDIIQPGGLLALPSNIGRTQDHPFAVVPEAGFTIGYQATENLRLFVGYTFLYWNNVARPGDQVDRILNTTQIPNNPQPNAPATTRNRPIPLRENASFWAQGLNFGMECKY